MSGWIFAACGAVRAGISYLINTVSNDHFRALYPIIGEELQKWNKHGEDAVADCHKFVYDSLRNSPESLPQVAIGVWVLNGILQRTPTFEEAEVATAPGIFCPIVCMVGGHKRVSVGAIYPVRFPGMVSTHPRILITFAPTGRVRISSFPAQVFRAGPIRG